MTHDEIIMLKITPTSKKVLLVLCKEPQIQGGLILPDKKQTFFKVIRVADDCEVVKEGDKVLVDLSARGIYRSEDFIIADESAIAAIKMPETDCI